MPVEFEARNGTIFANLEPFKIKGINWYGMEGHDGVLGGLTKRRLEDLLDFVEAKGFNAIRLAVSAWNVISGEHLFPDVSRGENWDMVGMNYLQQLDYIINECSKRWILVSLSMHRLNIDDCARPAASSLRALLPPSLPPSLLSRTCARSPIPLPRPLPHPCTATARLPSPAAGLAASFVDLARPLAPLLLPASADYEYGLKSESNLEWMCTPHRQGRPRVHRVLRAAAPTPTARARTTRATAISTRRRTVARTIASGTVDISLASMEEAWEHLAERCTTRLN